jgi:hypothetical protein
MSTQNDLTKTYGGLLGNTVYVNKGKRKTLLTMPPTKPKPEPSPKQLAVWKRMSLAALHARNARNEPDLWAKYEEKATKKLPAFQVAMRDFLRPPFIQEINVSQYHGKPGDKISVAAGDDFMVKNVTVHIKDPGGNPIEEGPGVFTMPSGQYDYIATRDVDDLTGITITAIATDLPNHSTERSLTL